MRNRIACFNPRFADNSFECDFKSPRKNQCRREAKYDGDDEYLHQPRRRVEAGKKIDAP